MVPPMSLSLYVCLANHLLLARSVQLELSVSPVLGPVCFSGLMTCTGSYAGP
ncbi:hypothetical protein NEOLEDRAFT_1137261 [Neolentinus lepideus HHB14362 ss-1]|uniref:Uncharacterized protein n=1 Tax=Neolentinus lepideus HHB14362 ss-1 TaxID=1314782 RepID=A0A165QV50_9AGAM|nr:hypothetical protein NEOLEDRAFT_1137261 [Neolentinus lepideus HHB14362 ss-1]